MLPELGHFALILAAPCGFAGLLRDRRRRICGVIAGSPAVAPAVAGQFVMIATAVALPHHSVRDSRFLRALRRREFQLRAATFLPRHGALGRA